MKKFIIYRLFDKRSPEITRYVGLTANFPQRMAQHLLCNGQNPGKDKWIQTPGVEAVGEIIDTKPSLQEARLCEAYWIHHYRSKGMPLTNQFIPALLAHVKDTGTRIKLIKVKFPEQSPVWRDLVAYAEEQGIPPAEAARSILTQWSRALRGMNAFGGMVIPQQALPTPIHPVKPEPQLKREQDKAKGARFVGTLNILDDD